MNNQSPLIPQGSLLEQRNKGRAKVKIAVFLVLAIHGVGLMALLMQGCKKEPDAGAGALAPLPEATNNAAPAFVEPTNTLTAPSNLVSTLTNAAPPPVSVPTEPPPQAVTPPPASPASDYVILKGDSFSTVAKKFHVSVKALLEANPSVEPTKLKVGQTIHIPPATAPAAVTAGTAATASVAGSDSTGHAYTVKSGDSLTKIAGQFGVSVKALRTFNNLKTDKIVVGQKLNIPAKTSTSAPAGTAGAANAPSGQ
jgi:LysM repeat protein